MKNSKKRVKLFLLLPIIVAAGFTLAGCTGDDDVADTGNSAQTEIQESNSDNGDWNANITQCNNQCEMMGSVGLGDTCFNGCVSNFASSEDDFNYCLEMVSTDNDIQGLAQGGCMTRFTRDEGPEVCAEVEGLARDICYGTYVDDTGDVEYCAEIDDDTYSSMCANLSE